MIDILNTKEELASYGVKLNPKNFIATYTNLVPKKGKNNKIITVYVLAKDGTPYKLGSNSFSTASCMGEKAEGVQVIREVYGYKMKDGYYFKDPAIQLHIL